MYTGQGGVEMDRAGLRELLHRHQPADATEEGHRQRMLALLDVEGDPFARAHVEPGHFTASTFVLSTDGRRLLLIFHGKLHLWLQPGGHIDAGDSDVFAAARREATEETGLLALGRERGFPDLLDLDIHPIPPNPRKGEPAHEHFDVRIVLRADHERAVAGSDALDVKWVDLDGIEDVDTDESVMRAVRKLRGSRRAARPSS